MLSSQVKKFEQESEELQARAVEVQRQREVLERRIADLEIVNDQLQQESHVSFTDCVSRCHVARSCYFHPSLLYPEVRKMTELWCFTLEYNLWKKCQLLLSY